jgi:hypothetical protein
MSEEKAMRLPTARERHEKEQAYFGRQLADFIRRWRPNDRSDEAHHFESETYFLIQRAQQLAQEPIMTAYTELAATIPMTPFLVPKQPGSKALP